jgi:hypothetical protein
MPVSNKLYHSLFGLVRAILGLGALGLLAHGPLHGAEPAVRLLFGGESGFALSTLRPQGVSVTEEKGRLRVHAEPGEGQSLVFPLAASGLDLSAKRYVEAVIANRGESPLVFTFWAHSGQGWGGASTFPAGNAAGRETLAPGASATFRIDLHACYPGKQVYTPATNPASVQWLELVFESQKQAIDLEVISISATGEGLPLPAAIARRVLVPAVVDGPPAPGRRVFRQLPAFADTAVRHVLTLPKEWVGGNRFPILVEYSGNRFFHKFCYSTGHTADSHMAYGLARGEGYICLNLPFISEDGQREQTNGWGDIDRGVAYCEAAIDEAVQNFGGDPKAIIFVGFSRGSYAGNYLALRNERIASRWRGFITSMDPGMKWTEKGGGWNKVGVGWDERAARRQVPWIYVPEELGEGVHVDVGFLEDRPSTIQTRQWLDQLAHDPASK